MRRDLFILFNTRYEDFVLKPQDILESIYSFLDLPFYVNQLLVRPDVNLVTVWPCTSQPDLSRFVSHVAACDLHGQKQRDCDENRRLDS